MDPVPLIRIKNYCSGSGRPFFTDPPDTDPNTLKEEKPVPFQTSQVQKILNFSTDSYHGILKSKPIDTVRHRIL
jgi:hypothetical protein